MKKLWMGIIVILFAIGLNVGFASSVSEIQDALIAALYGEQGGYVSCDYDGYVTTEGAHEGIDICCWNGASVYSVCDGEITAVNYGKEGRSEPLMDYLSTIAVYYEPQDKTIVYLHMVPVSGLYAGKSVAKGEIIGTQSWRGVTLAKNGHTHIEVRNGLWYGAASSTGNKILENDYPYPFWESILIKNIDSVTFDTYAIEDATEDNIKAGVWLSNPSGKTLSTIGMQCGTNKNNAAEKTITGNVAWTRAHLSYDVSSYYGKLASNTTYYIRYYVVVDGTKHYSEWIEARTVKGDISFDNYNVSNLYQSDVQVSVWLDNPNGRMLSKIGIEAGKNKNNLTNRVIASNVGWTRSNQISYLSATLGYLESDTRYYARYYAVVGNRYYYSDWFDITIPSGGLSFDTYSVGSINDRNALIGVWGNNPSGYTLSEIGMMMGKSTSSTSRKKIAENVKWTRFHMSYNVSQYFGNLEPNTTYYVAYYIKMGDKNFYTDWQSFRTKDATKYTVTLAPNGGSVSPTSVTVAYSGVYSGLPTPSRTGYSFDGWYNSNGTKIGNGSKATQFSNHTLTAHWTANKYTVTLNPSSGTVSPTSVTVTYDGTYGTLPNPSRTGYTFDGWYTQASGGTKITNTSKVTTAGNHGLHAHWTKSDTEAPKVTGGNLEVLSATKCRFTITATDNIGVDHVDIHTYYGSWTSAGDTVYKGIKSGNNWYYEIPCELGGQDRKIDARVYDAAGNQALNSSGYPDINAILNYVKVTFDVGGGVCSETNRNVIFALFQVNGKQSYVNAYGKLKALPIPTKNGYTFDGWYTDAVGGTKITDATMVTKTTAHTLYARWTPNQYDATFYNNYSGGNYIVNGDFTSALVEDHWFSRDTAVSTLSIDGSVLHDSHRSLRIENAQVGANMKDLRFRTLTNIGKYDGGVNEEKEMVLSFWGKSSNDGTKMYFRWGYEKEGDYRSVTLTKDWKHYTVSMSKTAYDDMDIHPYVDRSGTVWLSEVQLEDGANATAFVHESGDAKTVKQTFSQKYALPNVPTRDGYAFLGWFTSARGGKQVTNNTPVEVGNIRLYAHWQPDEYNVTLIDEDSRQTIGKKLHDIDFKLPEMPDKDDMVFIDFNTSADGRGKSYPSGGSYAENKAVTLYVRYRPRTRLTLPKGLKVIEEEAFMGVAAEVIIVPEGCVEIKALAFMDCKSARKIYIPASVKNINFNAFKGCSALTICAPSGSTAIEFAKDFNMPYEVTGD